MRTMRRVTVFSRALFERFSCHATQRKKDVCGLLMERRCRIGKSFEHLRRVNDFEQICRQL